MNQRSKNKTKAPVEDAASHDVGWSVQKRAIASLLIAFHVTAVFVAPWSQPPPASELSAKVGRWFQPYQHAVYIYHGYRFFAPNPGPSHVVDYELTFADGSTREGRFPDPEEYWPRLHYHRYLMLAETVDQFSRIPPEPQRPPSQLSARLGQREMAAYQQAIAQREGMIAKRDLLLNAVAQRLIADHDAQSVKMWAVEHTIAMPEAVLDGARLDAPESYLRRELGEFTRSVP